MLHVAICLLLAAAAPCNGKKVLLIPFNTPSHLLQLGGCGDGIVKAGHQATMVVHAGQMVPPSIIKSGIKVITYRTDDKVFPMETAEVQLRSVNISRTGSMYQMMKDLLNKLAPEVKKLVHNEELISKLKKEKFDFAVVDGSQFSSPFFVIPYRLGIPWASVTPYMPLFPMSIGLQTPLLLPVPILPFSETSTFLQRFLTVLAARVMAYSLNGIYDDEEFKRTCETPFTSLNDLMLKTTLWLVDQNDLVDVPKPSMPNAFFIGGLSVSPSRPLPVEFKTYADDAKEGLIVMTFGGTLGYLPRDYVDRIILGIEKVKYRVIWRQKTKPSVKVPSNLKIVDWMPQNDLLGHPNTRLFITHCGSNGQHEAVYHGVPMLGLPVLGDQRYNAQRFTTKGYGRYLDITSFKTQELADAINDVISDPRYKKMIQKVSRIFKSRQMLPRETAAYWVDHIMEHGADHMISYTDQLSWYQILLLDVIAAFIVIFGILSCVIVMIIKSICNRCCRRKEKVKRQ
jgi:hypothetical protein